MSIHQSHKAPKMTFGAPVIIDHEDLREWQIRMKFTYDDAAQVLGVDRSTYAVWLRGTSRTTGKPLPLPRVVALAAMAVEMGLHQNMPPPQIRHKGRQSRESKSPDSKEE